MCFFVSVDSLHFLKFYINGIIQYVLFLPGFFHSVWFWDSSLLLCVSIVRLYCRVVFHCIEVPQFVCHSSTSGFRLILGFGSVESSCEHSHSSLWVSCFLFSLIDTYSGMVGLYCRCMFNPLRSCQTDFPVGCAILYSLQLCRRVSVALGPHQHSIWPVILKSATYLVLCFCVLSF